VIQVLIVEDEESLADPLAYLLRKEGFEVTVVADGPSALAEFDRAGADIVLLDLMLPGMSGTEVCRHLRARSSVPVIMVTARDSEIDKVVGLELGADDYVTKPYSARELIARIRAVLRRGADADDAGERVLEAGPVRMDIERHIVTVEDPIEYQLTGINQIQVKPQIGLTFANLLRSILRQDPDVILVGELRDLETMEAAITAAETGHLVFGTLHTTGAAKTIDRIVNAFPQNQQEQIRIQLSTVLQAVISQLLVPRVDKPGRVAVFEVMVNTPSVGALIRDNKTFRIQSDIQTGAKYGMVTLDSFLLDKWQITTIFL
jgi:CheY-like chemotaxis protein